MQGYADALSQVQQDRYRRDWISAQYWPLRCVRQRLRLTTAAPHLCTASDLQSSLNEALDFRDKSLNQQAFSLHSHQHVHFAHLYESCPKATSVEWKRFRNDPASARAAPTMH